MQIMLDNNIIYILLFVCRYHFDNGLIKENKMKKERKKVMYVRIVGPYGKEICNIPVKDGGELPEIPAGSHLYTFLGCAKKEIDKYQTINDSILKSLEKLHF